PVADWRTPRGRKPWRADRETAGRIGSSASVSWRGQGDRLLVVSRNHSGIVVAAGGLQRDHAGLRADTLSVGLAQLLEGVLEGTALLVRRRRKRHHRHRWQLSTFPDGTKATRAVDVRQLRKLRIVDERTHCLTVDQLADRLQRALCRDQLKVGELE